MSADHGSEEEPEIAEATAENGRAFVPRRTNKVALEAKFNVDDVAWLKPVSPERPVCKVIVVGKQKTPRGTWEYQLRYHQSGKEVIERGADWFPETRLTRTPPYDAT